MTGEGTPFDDILTLMASDFAAAKARLQDMVRAEPDSFDAHFMLGFIHSRRQDYGAAATALSRAVEIRPGAQVALFNLGYCRQQLGDLAGALEYYRAALRASGGSYGDASVLAGQCYHRLGDAAAACALLETALADHPNDARLFYVLMGALRDEGRDGAADRRAARLGELVADERDEVGLAEFFNRYDHHGWARLDNKATLAGMVAGCPWQPESFAMPGGFADLETAHERHGGPWIVKPAALFGGQGITVTDDLARVPREDGWLVQRYINDPYLIDGKKFHLRLYVLVTSVAPPEAWLWHDGIVRFAAEVYRVDPEHFAREAMHVTNTVRFQDHPDLVVADDVADDGTGNVWSLDALYRRLEDDGAESPRPALEKLAAGLMAAIEAAGVFADQATVPRRSTAPKLLGLDVLLDSAGRPWLLEVERYPALGGGAAAVVDAVNGRLLKAMVELALETPDQDLGPTAKKCGFTALFSRRPGGVSAA